MAKYSTGNGGGGAGDTCELCGETDPNLRSASVAGADLQVCSDCVQHDERTEPDRGRQTRDGERAATRAARNTARMHDAASNDAGHWESGADYDDDQLPYLVSGYDDKLTAARQDAGLQIGELAGELDVEEADLLALEQGRAAQAGVGGSVVDAIESHLDVELAESN